MEEHGHHILHMSAALTLVVAEQMQHCVQMSAVPRFQSDARLAGNGYPGFMQHPAETQRTRSPAAA